MTVDFAARLAGKKQGLLEERLSVEERRLLKAARGIDNVDRVMGPVSAGLRLYGSEFWQGVGTVIGAAELFFLKVPFMYYYQKETKDFASLYFWGAKEAFSNGFAIGGLLDIFHSYSGLARRHFEREVMRENKKYYK